MDNYQSIRGGTGAAGTNGKDGKDYVLTEADKNEIIGAVITAIGTPIAGTINENNEILLGGELAEGTYKLRWFNQNEYVQICTLSVDGSGTITPDNPDTPDEPVEIKNWLNFGTTEVGGTEIYNGKGWKEDTRWSASGNAPSTREDMFLTGIIPVNEGDTVYTYDMPWVSSLSETAYLARYYSNSTIDEVNLSVPFTDGTLVPDENGVYSFDVPSGVVGIRFSCFGISDASMITINQYPIE
jgi:hypothetical protein